jgi:hypothetical protein
VVQTGNVWRTRGEGEHAVNHKLVPCKMQEDREMMIH